MVPWLSFELLSDLPKTVVSVGVQDFFFFPEAARSDLKQLIGMPRNWVLHLNAIDHHSNDACLVPRSEVAKIRLKDAGGDQFDANVDVLRMLLKASVSTI